MEIFDITIPANGSQRINAQGRYFRYHNGSAGGADSRIKIQNTENNYRAVLAPGQSLQIPPEINPGLNWIISNYANSGGILGNVYIGDGEIVDDTITGSVSVLDGGKARTQGGTAFSSASGLTVAAGQYAAVLMANPAGSGKNLYIESFLLSSGSSGQYWAGTIDTITGTLNGLATSKQAGGANGVGKLYNASTAGALPGAAKLNVAGLLVANQQAIINFREPVQLPPGFNFYSQMQVAAASLFMSIEHFEESV